MNWYAIVWLVLMVVFLYVESSTVALVCIWFAVGALTAMIMSLFGLPLWSQVLAFFAVAAVLLALLRPLFRKFIKPKIEKTNLDAVVGTTGVVTGAIDNINGQGQVKLGGMVWTARSTDGQPIGEGTVIRVDRIEGVKVFVSVAETAAIK